MNEWYLQKQKIERNNTSVSNQTNGVLSFLYWQILKMATHTTILSTQKGRVSIRSWTPGYDAVMSLIHSANVGQGYNLYVDSFYTCPLLFQTLLDMKVGACGTIREGRRGYPSTQENDRSRKSPRGLLHCIYEGGVVYVKWMDSGVVSVCSTVHTAFSSHEVASRKRLPDGT